MANGNWKHYGIMHLTVVTPTKNKSLSIWNLCSSGMLCRTGWYLVTNVLGHPVGPIFKDQAVKHSNGPVFLHCLTSENGTNKLSHNIGNWLVTNSITSQKSEGLRQKHEILHVSMVNKPSNSQLLNMLYKQWPYCNGEYNCTLISNFLHVLNAVLCFFGYLPASWAFSADISELSIHSIFVGVERTSDTQDLSWGV